MRLMSARSARKRSWDHTHSTPSKLGGRFRCLIEIAALASTEALLTVLSKASSVLGHSRQMRSVVSLTESCLAIMRCLTRRAQSVP